MAQVFLTELARAFGRALASDGRLGEASLLLGASPCL